MPSRLKRAHRTHALSQPAGEPYPHLAAGQAAGRSGDGRLLALLEELRELVPDAVQRAGVLGVAPETEAAWQRGAALPVLRAHRKALERAVLSRRAG